MGKTEKIVISNNSDKPLLISLEPWGADFTLKAEESFELIAENCEEDFFYEISYENEYVAVYVNGDSDYPCFYNNGELLETGHNRGLVKLSYE